MKWLFGDDPHTRSRQVLHEDGDGWVIDKKADIEPILRHNQALRNSASDYQPWKGSWHWVASVPTVALERMYHKIGRKNFIAWFRDHKAIDKWLDDRDQEPFRTKPGKLSR